MEPIFPGMDPYLEQPSFWADVHASLIYAIREQLLGRLGQKYTAVITPYVAFESLEITPTRTGMAVPDVSVLGTRLPEEGGVAVAEVDAPPLTLTEVMEIPTTYGRVEIRTVDGETLVTAIVVLSPANKRPGANGLDAYLQKRKEFLRSWSHLLEIDLLRAGQRTPLTARPQLPPDPYFVFLSRAGYRPQVAVWPIGLRKTLPTVPVPLLHPDPDVPLSLGAALRQIYKSARYERRINYQADPPPPEISAEDLAWIDAQLRERGMR